MRLFSLPYIHVYIYIPIYIHVYIYPFHKVWKEACMWLTQMLFVLLNDLLFFKKMETAVHPTTFHLTHLQQVKKYNRLLSSVPLNQSVFKWTFQHLPLQWTLTEAWISNSRCLGSWQACPDPDPLTSAEANGCYWERCWPKHFLTAASTCPCDWHFPESWCVWWAVSVSAL